MNTAEAERINEKLLLEKILARDHKIHQAEVADVMKDNMILIQEINDLRAQIGVVNADFEAYKLQLNQNRDMFRKKQHDEINYNSQLIQNLEAALQYCRRESKMA